MTEVKETVTTSQDEGISDSGAQVQQETRKVDKQVVGDSKSTASNAVWYIVGLIEILLGLRFILKLLGANPSSGFVNLIYTITNVLTAPFDSIFGVTRPEAGNVSSIFEPSILVAALVYFLIGWGIVKLLNLNRPA